MMAQLQKIAPVENNVKSIFECADMIKGVLQCFPLEALYTVVSNETLSLRFDLLFT